SFVGSTRPHLCTRAFRPCQRRTPMKIKMLLVGLVALLSVSTAVAAPPTGKGKPPTTGVGCKPQVTVVLRGTFVSASAGSLSMSVVGAPRWGRARKRAGTAAAAVDQHPHRR